MVAATPCSKCRNNIHLKVIFPAVYLILNKKKSIFRAPTQLPFRAHQLGLIISITDRGNETTLIGLDRGFQLWLWDPGINIFKLPQVTDFPVHPRMKTTGIDHFLQFSPLEQKSSQPPLRTWVSAIRQNWDSVSKEEMRNSFSVGKPQCLPQ